jgi:hypothetical protein
MKGEMERVGVELSRAMEELHREHGGPADWFRDGMKADVADRSAEKSKGSSKKAKARKSKAPSKKAKAPLRKAKQPSKKKRDRS